MKPIQISEQISKLAHLSQVNTSRWDFITETLRGLLEHDPLFARVIVISIA